MDHLKLIRFATCQYFLEKFFLAEGITDELRAKTKRILEDSEEFRTFSDRITMEMNTVQRFTAIGRFLDLLKTSETHTRTYTQPEWVGKVRKIFVPGSGDIIDHAAGVYEFIPVRVGGNTTIEVRG